MLENAKLVKLKIRQFGNTRQDEEITAEVTTDKHLGNGAGKWMKAKLPPEFLKPARQFAGRIRQWHYGLTCPWDEGMRLLADKTLIQYREELALKEHELSEIVAGIDYPAALARAREIHNGTFDQSDYPSWEEFKRCYGVGVEYLPVPRGAQLTVEGLAKGEVEAMREELETANAARLEAAVENVWARLLEPVQALAAKLSNTEAKVYRESLVGNIQDILSRVDALNITGNTQLTRAAEEIKAQLGALDIEQIKSDPVEREAVAKRAERLLAQFGAMGARSFALESEAA